MAYEKTLLAAKGTLVREQEYDFHWCYERGIITKAWFDIFEATGERQYYEAARQDADQFIEADGQIRTYEMQKYNLDMICMGRTALRLYKATGEEKYKKACLLLLEQMKNQPRTPEGGFWHKEIYPNQMWLDGIYMACPFLAEVAEALNMPEWADEAVRQMQLIYAKTRLPDGLHAHAWDSARTQKWADPETGVSPHVWGRAMGWFIMAHVDVLAALPETNPGRTVICRQLENLINAVLSVRGDDRLWHQVLDCPASEENYAESSCSSMFIYALAKSAKLGVGPEGILETAEESMTALWNASVVTAEDGYPELTRICKVAGLGGEPYRDGSYEYYVNETVCSGDTKGTAPFLMALNVLAV